jgi:hypothetical protein
MFLSYKFAPAIFLVACFVLFNASSTDAWLIPSKMMKSVAAVGLAAGLYGVPGGMMTPPSVYAAEEPSIASQLAAIQAGETLKNQGRLDSENGAALARELQLAPYQLIARGVISLSCDKIDNNMYPIGLPDASNIDDKYSSDNNEASLIILGVGREGGAPLAAKKVPVNDLKFPYVFTLETSDLLFPYNTQAWEDSANSKDTIAVSAFLTPTGKLSTPDAAVRVGFGLSDPMRMAGVVTRSSAQIKVANKLDGKLYTEEEVAVLSGVDEGIVKNAQAAAAKGGKK